MSIIWLIVVLLIAGVVLALAPMDPQIRSLTIKVIIIVVVIFLILWVAQMFRLVSGGPPLR